MKTLADAIANLRDQIVALADAGQGWKVNYVDPYLCEDFQSVSITCDVGDAGDDGERGFVHAGFMLPAPTQELLFDVYRRAAITAAVWGALAEISAPRLVATGQPTAPTCSPAA